MSNCSWWWSIAVAIAFSAGYLLASLMWATRREAEEEIFGNETSFDNDWTPYDKPTVIRNRTTQKGESHD
jgi:hypothetical protein